MSVQYLILKLDGITPADTWPGFGIRSPRHWT
jgi:hypothetical protein